MLKTYNLLVDARLRDWFCNDGTEFANALTENREANGGIKLLLEAFVVSRFTK